MIRGFAILLSLQLLGVVISDWMSLPIPGNVFGMGLLLCALLLGWIKVDWLDEAADLLLSNMALFFVPAGVGVMVYADLIAREWLPICVGLVLSTFIVMAVTGWVEQALSGGGE